MARVNDFDDSTQKAAALRQKGRCAFCGTVIKTPWTPGLHIGHAHHLKPILHGGTATLDNCVYLCEGDHKLMGHGMAPSGIDKQGGSSRTMVAFSKSDFKYWNG
jgi:predicted restriction endonuclease